MLLLFMCSCWSFSGLLDLTPRYVINLVVKYPHKAFCSVSCELRFLKEVILSLSMDHIFYILELYLDLDSFVKWSWNIFPAWSSEQIFRKYTITNTVIFWEMPAGTSSVLPHWAKPGRIWSLEVQALIAMCIGYLCCTMHITKDSGLDPIAKQSCTLWRIPNEARFLR